MKLVAMRFDGVVWHHNPRLIRFVSEENVRVLAGVQPPEVVQQSGRKNVAIEGEGELYGADCLEQFDRLLSLFRRGREGTLSLPGFKPVMAVFESLTLLAQPSPDVLTYRFRFREVRGQATDKPQSVVTQGETLWDISYRFDLPIDALVRLNPQVKRPDVVAEGTVIALC